MKPFLLGIYLYLFWCNNCQAQQPVSPGPRARGHFIFHPKSKTMLLIDGYVNHLDSTQSDVWQWNGKTWHPIAGFGPGSRSANAAALNKQTGNIEIFGGWGKGSIQDTKNDVWSFNGRQWKRFKTDSVSTHDHHKMVYADHLNAFVIYGGRNSASNMPDSTTWLLKDGRFIALNIPGPGPRGNAGYAYDPLRKKVVLVGGKSPNLPADLWEFDGDRWEQILIPSTNLSTGQEMAYHEDLKAILIHGNAETWLWDGKLLTKITDGGPTGSCVALGYDPTRKVIVAYGGFIENRRISTALWELKDKKWKKITDTGPWQQTGLNKYERVTE